VTDSAKDPSTEITLSNEAGQISMVAMVIALAVVLVLSAILIGISVTGNDTGGTGTSGAPGVGTADNLVAQTTLSTIEPAIEIAAESGGYGSLTPAMLESNAPGATYTAGPSTSSHIVSVATSGGSPGQSTGITLPGGGNVPSLGGDGSGGSTASPATATFAVYSNSGNCYFQWYGPGGPVDGVETGQHSCQATAFTSVPPASAPSSTTIGWQAGSFPTT
jgi:hypothetical protein